MKKKLSDVEYKKFRLKEKISNIDYVDLFPEREKKKKKEKSSNIASLVWLSDLLNRINNKLRVYFTSTL